MKPYELAARLELKPQELTRHAEDIERSGAYRFDHTPLGSFLFEPDDELIFRDYLELLAFFGRKKEALDHFKAIAEEKYRDRSRPEWMKWLTQVIWRQ